MMSEYFGMQFKHNCIISWCYMFLCYFSDPDVPEVELPEVVSYFDLESFPGVTELKREKDANSEPISIPLGLLFGDRVVTAAYVSSSLHFLTVLNHRRKPPIRQPFNDIHENCGYSLVRLHQVLFSAALLHFSPSPLINLQHFSGQFVANKTTEMYITYTLYCISCTKMGLYVNSVLCFLGK